MPQVIDIKSTTLVVKPGKMVKFENMMGGGGGPNGPAGKNVRFSNKEYANVAKTVVLVGQSLKKLNVNVRDIKKMMSDDLKLQKADRAAAVRRERESRIERRRGNIPGTGAVKEVAGAGKSLLERILAPLAGLGNIALGFIGYAGIKKLLDSDFVKFAVNGFVNLVGGIVNAVKNVPPEVFSKAGKAIGRFLGFVGNFVGGSIGRAFKGLDQVLDSEGRLRFSLKGIVNLITGIGGIALAFRYLKNPTKIISDVGSVIRFLGSGIAGLARMLPGGAAVKGAAGGAGKMFANAKAGLWQLGGNLKNAPGNAKAFLDRNRVSMKWGGPLPGSQYYDDVMTPATRGARAVSEYGAGVFKAGGRKGLDLLKAAPGAALKGTKGLFGGAAGLAGKGLKGIGGRIPILGSLLAGGLEFAQTGNAGRAGGAAIGTGLGTAIGAGIGSVIPGAGTVVGGLAGGIIGEFLGKTIGEGVMSVFKGFDFGETVMKPLSKSFKWVTDSFKEPVRMFMDAFGLSKEGKEKGESGFISALKNIGKIIGILAKLLLKVVVPTLQIVMGAIGKAVEAVTFVIKGVAKVVGGIMNGFKGLMNMLPDNILGYDIKSVKDGVNNFDFGKLLDAASGAVDKIPSGFARGGKIFGGKPSGDSVPAYLERGEYVMNRKAVSAVGHKNLDKLNFGMFPRFQTGGAVGDGRTSNTAQRILAGARSIIGKGRGVSDQCANTTRAALRSAGHPAAAKRTQIGDLDTPRGTAYNAPSFAASFGGSDMGKVISKKSDIKAGDIILWRADRNKGGNINKGAITHVGIAASDGLKTQYDHNKSRGWHYRNHWHSSAGTSWFAGIRLGESGGSLPPGVSGAGGGNQFGGDARDSGGVSGGGGGGGLNLDLSPTSGATSSPGITAATDIRGLTEGISNLISQYTTNMSQPSPLFQQIPQLFQQTQGTDPTSMLPAGSSAGSSTNSFYELLSMGGNS